MSIWLIGSRAAQVRMDIGREPKDYDLVMNKDDFERFKRIHSNKLECIELVDFGLPGKYRCRLNDIDIDIDVESEESSKNMSNRAEMNITRKEVYIPSLGIVVFVPSLVLLWAFKLSHGPYFYNTFDEISYDTRMMGGGLFGTGEGHVNWLLDGERTVLQLKKAEARKFADVRGYVEGTEDYSYTQEYDLHDFLAFVYKEASRIGNEKSPPELKLRVGSDKLIYRYGLKLLCCTYASGSFLDRLWYNMHLLWDYDPSL